MFQKKKKNLKHNSSGYIIVIYYLYQRILTYCAGMIYVLESAIEITRGIAKVINFQAFGWIENPNDDGEIYPPNLFTGTACSKRVHNLIHILLLNDKKTHTPENKSYHCSYNSSNPISMIPVTT